MRDNSCLKCLFYCRLHSWQVAFVKDDQTDYAAYNADYHQQTGIPPGQLMVEEWIDGGRVVERRDVEHPAKLIRKAAKGVEQVTQRDDAQRCATSSATGVQEGAAQYADSRCEEEKGPLH